MHDLLTAGAGQARALYLLYDVMAWDILQFFYHIRAKFFEATTTVFTAITWHDPLFLAL